jgi:hypothetical protein
MCTKKFPLVHSKKHSIAPDTLHINVQPISIGSLYSLFWIYFGT